MASCQVFSCLLKPKLSCISWVQTILQWRVLDLYTNKKGCPNDIAALPVPNAAEWLLFEPSWFSPRPFPNLDNGLGPGPLPCCEAAATSRPSRFCLACSAISCHFESTSLPPTAWRAATFAAFVLILSSSSLLGCVRLRIQEMEKSHSWDITVEKLPSHSLGDFPLFPFPTLQHHCHQPTRMDLVNQIDHLILEFTMLK